MALIAASAFPTMCRAEAATFVSDADAGSTLGHFHYYGRWEHVHHLHDGRLFGTSSRTNSSDALVTLSFVGKVVRVYGVRGPGGGYGIVTLDDKRFPAIDFYSPKKVARAVVFSSPLLRGGTHTLRIARAGNSHLLGLRRSYINVSGAAYH